MLKDLMGVNPEYNEDIQNIKEETNKNFVNVIGDMTTYANMYCLVDITEPRETILIGHKLHAEALCSKWLDGLNPLIESQPENVLTELLEDLSQL